MQLWINKYKPMHSSEITRNYNSVMQIKKWLKNYDSTNVKTNLLITGTHGIGKTTIISQNKD